MKLLKGIKFQTRLLLFFTIIIVAIILIFTYFFYDYYSQVILDNHINNIEDFVYSAGAELEEAFSQGQKLITNIKHSPYINEVVYTLSFLEQYDDLDSENTGKILKLQEAIEIMRYAESDYINRITIFNSKGVIATASNYYTPEVYTKTIAVRYKQIVASNETITNYMYHIYSGNDIWVEKDIPVIIIVSSFSDIPNTMVEIQLKGDLLDQVHSDMNKTFPILETVIYDDDGEIAYVNSTDGKEHFANINDFNSENTESKIINVDRNNNYVRYDMITNNWIIGVKYDDSRIRADVRKAALLIGGISIIGILIIMYVTNYVMKIIIKPLKNLVQLMDDTSFDDLSNEANIGHYNDDIAYLPDAFNDMLRRLNESKNMAIEAGEREAKAKLAALQAQINPHFICNTLSVIGLKSYENGQEDILETCSSLTEMMRYVTYNTNDKTTLENEIEYAKNYLNIMQLRYPDMAVNFDIDEKLGSIMVPKLILQPLIENSIKHGHKTNNNVLKIFIKGRIKNNMWKIDILDNGIGFRKEKIAEIYKNIKFISQNTDGVDDKSDSIGIMNVYNRMYLTFGQNMVLHINNLENGGACVILGGNIND